MIQAAGRDGKLTWRHLALAAVLIGTATLLLASMGRNLLCTCGNIRLWYGDAWGAENSQQLTDPYTFTHGTHGILIYALLRLLLPRTQLATRAVMGVGLESLWEVLENTNTVIDRYRAATMAIGYYGDSVLNSVGDILACAAGFALAARLPARVSVAIVVLLELALTILIRDSLLLNVVMLVHPIEAVKVWQMQK